MTTTLARRVLIDLGLITCWLVVWFGSITVGIQVGQRVVGPEEIQGYLALAGIAGVMKISPAGLVLSTFFLWGKRHNLLFVLCGVAVGLVAALWPLILR